MSVRLSARGRDGAIRISLSCGVECVEVRVKVAGGVPPYEVRWDDGETGAVRTLCADPQRPRGGVVQDASSGRNEPVSFALAPIDFFPCDSPEHGYRVCFSPGAVASQCSQGADSGASFDLGKPIPAGVRFEAEVTVRGIVASPDWSPALLTSSQDCVDQATLPGSSQDLDRDQHTMYLIEGGSSYEIRYITVAESDIFGGPLQPPTFDAGRPEVESVVLCEYFAVPEMGSDGGASP